MTRRIAREQIQEGFLGGSDWIRSEPCKIVINLLRLHCISSRALVDRSLVAGCRRISLGIPRAVALSDCVIPNKEEQAATFAS